MGEKIDAHAFKLYCQEVAKRFVQLYPWYYMPPSMHVILIHGYRIIENMIFTLRAQSVTLRTLEQNSVR